MFSVQTNQNRLEERVIIGYARCSKANQDAALQHDALNRAGCERIFTEHVSGLSTERPQLQAALDFARSGDSIAVYKLDRLGRSTRQLIQTVEELRVRDIGLVSLTEAIDTSTAAGRLVFHIFASLSQAEVDNLRERTRAGLAAAKARGRVGGRPRVVTDAKLSMAKALLADGDLTVRQVAQEVGVGVSTLYRAAPQLRARLANAA